MKKIILSIAVLMAATVTLTSCDDDDDDNNPLNPDPIETLVLDGVYVINEGSYYSQINGSLDFLAYNGETETYTMNRNIFDAANGRSLGGTPNHGALFGDSILCIAVHEENRVEFVNTKTKKAYEPVTISQPREIAVSNELGCIFVTSYAGKVSKIDMSTRSVITESEQIKGNLEGIAFSGNNLYVCTGWNSDYTYNNEVVMLKASTMEQIATKTVIENPTQVIATNRGLFVLSMGNYGDVKATVQCMKNGEITEIGNATMMAYNATNEKLYMINAPYGAAPEYKVYDAANGTTATFLTQPDIFLPYAIATNDFTGEVYITSLSESTDYPGSASYTTDGTIYRYSDKGILTGSYPCGVCPGTIVCGAHIENK